MFIRTRFSSFVCKVDLDQNRRPPPLFARYTVECQAQIEKQRRVNRSRTPVTSLFGLTDDDSDDGDDEETPTTTESKDDKE